MDQAQQLLIPEKIKIGFQNRGGTYTGKLAYVIYYDRKGVLRKEKSWQSWRDHKIADQEFTNEPTEGFVLNKKVGGYKSHWNFRDAHVRVYDPRDFEFEISVPNLLFILRECDCSRGKGLEGKFVYAWEGTELVLLPVNSEDYKKSADYTNLQSCKVKAKELIPGASYRTKKQEVYTYLGKFIKHVVHSDARWEKEKTGAKQVFWDGKDFVFLSGLTAIATLQSDTVTPDFAELVDKYNKSMWGSKPVRLYTKKARIPKAGYGHYWTKEESEGVYLQCSSSFQQHYDQNLKRYVYAAEPSSIHVGSKISIKDGVLVAEGMNKTAYRDAAENKRQKNSYRYYGDQYRDSILDKFIEPTGQALWVELESGSKYQISGTSLIDHTKKQTTDEDDYDDEEDY